MSSADESPTIEQFEKIVEKIDENTTTTNPTWIQKMFRLLAKKFGGKIKCSAEGDEMSENVTECQNAKDKMANLILDGSKMKKDGSESQLALAVWFVQKGI